MLFQTVSYTVVCVVLRDRHVENDPRDSPSADADTTEGAQVEMPLSRPSSDHIHELHVHDDGVAERTCRQRSCQEAS